MDSRERLLMAMNFEQPDTPPVDYYATPEIHIALKKYFGVKENHELLDCLQTDIRFVNPPYTGQPLPTFNDGSIMDIWGVIKKPLANEYGDYMEPVNLPFGDWTSVEEAEDYPWPDSSLYDFDVVSHLCEAFPDKAICCGNFGIQDFINGVAFGRGVEQVFVDIALEDPVYLFIVEKRHRFYMEYMERLLKAAKGRIDLVLCGDDFGSQRGLLISPTSFDALFAEKKKEFFDMVHSFGAKVSHHCCGSSRDLIPRFIELGMDALQTIQPQAAGMNPYKLKDAFRGKLVLHGGVDVQGFLQQASADEIVREVESLKYYVGKGGGYILSPSHNIQPDTPLENVLALYKAASQGKSR